MKTFETHAFTFSADSTSDTLPMTSCPLCGELFNANQKATRVEVSEDGEYVNDVLFHFDCLTQIKDFGARAAILKPDGYKVEHPTPDKTPDENAKFDGQYTTRSGGSFGGNSILTDHIIDRKTERTLCGRDTKNVGYGKGWTNEFDHSSTQIGADDLDGGCCKKCAKSARKLGFTGKYFNPTRPAK